MSLRSEDGSRRGSTADSSSTVALALARAFRSRGTRAFRSASARDATDAAERDKSARSALAYWASCLSFSPAVAALASPPSISMAVSSNSSFFGWALLELPSSLAGGGRIGAASASRTKEATRAGTVSTLSPLPLLGGTVPPLPLALPSAVLPRPRPLPTAPDPPSSSFTATLTASGCHGKSKIGRGVLELVVRTCMSVDR